MTDGPAPSPGRPATRWLELLGLLRRAVDAQRAHFTDAIDADVLQLACAAQQDLLEIHTAQPSEPLRAAIAKVDMAIVALRALVDEQVQVDEQLMRDADVALRWADVGRVDDEGTEGPVGPVSARELDELTDALHASEGSGGRLARQLASLDRDDAAPRD